MGRKGERASDAPQRSGWILLELRRLIDYFDNQLIAFSIFLREEKSRFWRYGCRVNVGREGKVGR